MKSYIRIPSLGICIADIGGVGSYSLQKAIFNKYYTPADRPKIVGANITNAFNDGTSSVLSKRDKTVWPTIILSRDPVERFKAGCQHFKIHKPADIDKLLEDIEKQKLNTNYWFTSVVSYIDSSVDSLLFKYPQHLDSVIKTLKLSTDFTRDNSGFSFINIDLSRDQISKILQLYSEDYTLYKSISKPGQLAI